MNSLKPSRRTATGLLRTFALLCAALCAVPLWAASPVMVDINGQATAPALVYTEDAMGWMVTPSQNMLLDGLYSTFGRVGATTAMGPVLARQVQVSVFEGGPKGALKARASFTVDANGGQLGSEVAPVLLLGGRPYFVAFENLRNIGANVADWQVQQYQGVRNLSAWYNGAGFATVHPSYADGVLYPQSAPILRLQGKPVGNLPQVDCMLNWAAHNYPQYFAPRSAQSQTLYTFYYRHFEQTGIYLGISAADQNVYMMNSQGEIANLGALQRWLVAANCDLKR